MDPHLVKPGAAGPAPADPAPRTPRCGAPAHRPSESPSDSPLQTPSALALAPSEPCLPRCNQLIERLPPADRQRLLAVCDWVPLPLSDVLCAPDQASEHAYFPASGVISMALLADAHPGLEVGMVGCEGMLGLPLALGVQGEPLRATVQGAGAAWRLPAAALRREMAGGSALRSLLSRYVFVRMAELATGAACQRFHLIGPRLARRLLMSQDRAGAQRFHVTQEFLANMLGVRRVGVTTAAAALQRSGVIAYHRGDLTVLDRPGLEAAACSCYARDRQSYARLMG